MIFSEASFNSLAGKLAKIERFKDLDAAEGLRDRLIEEETLEVSMTERKVAQIESIMAEMAETAGLQETGHITDICCGKGRLTETLARRFQTSMVCGYDVRIAGQGRRTRAAYIEQDVFRLKEIPGDALTALHSCGSLTDKICTAVQRQRVVVISPCCYGKHDEERPTMPLDDNRVFEELSGRVIMTTHALGRRKSAYFSAVWDIYNYMYNYARMMVLDHKGYRVMFKRRRLVCRDRQVHDPYGYIILAKKE